MEERPGAAGASEPQILLALSSRRIRVLDSHLTNQFLLDVYKIPAIHMRITYRRNRAGLPFAPIQASLHSTVGFHPSRY